MASELQHNAGLSKEDNYDILFPQIEALIKDETDLIANMANVSAAIYTAMEYFWVGFYLVKHNQLVLGPFQGPIACTRINKGKGVCGEAWESGTAIVVPNVNLFPGHIACNSASLSEIVIPGFNKNGEVVFVLDIDSDKPAMFDHIDKKFLIQIVKILS